jgi:hypothetical protein
MTTAAPALTPIPATFSRAEIAAALGVPESRIKEWSTSKRRVVEPTSYDHDKSARYSREGLVLGLILTILQTVFGMGSPIPGAALDIIKARGVSDFADALRDGTEVGAIEIGLVREGVETKIKICDEHLCRRLRQRIVERVVEARS